MKGFVDDDRLHLIAQSLGALSLRSSARLWHEFFWVALGQGLAVVGGVFGVRLLTNALSPTSYGELALGMTIATLTHQVLLGPLSGAFLRFFAPAREANELGTFLLAVWVLLGRATIALVVVAVAFSFGLWLFGYTAWVKLVVAAFPFALISGYSSALDGMQNAARQRSIVACHQGFGQWLRFLMALAFISILGASSSTAMTGYAVASALVLVSQLLFFRREILLMRQPTVTLEGNIKQWTGKMINYAWPFAVWGVFTWGQMSSDRWALQAFHPTSTVGIYAVVYQLGYYPIILVSGLMMQLVSPVLFSRAGGGSEPDRLQSARHLNYLLVLGSVLMTAIGTVIAFLFHASIFSLVVASEYRSVSPVLPLMVLSSGLFCSGQAASLLFMTDTTTQRLISPKVVTALLGIVLNFGCALFFGLPGVVVAGVAFSLVYFIWMSRPTSLSLKSLGKVF